MQLISPFRRTAFTMVELLVVISIIGLLVALLLPSLSKARESARVTQCASNLRGINFATTMYLNDNKEAFPRGSNNAGHTNGDLISNKEVQIIYSSYLNGALIPNTSGGLTGVDGDIYSSLGMRFRTIGTFICPSNVRFTFNSADPGPNNYSRMAYALWPASATDFRMTLTKLERAARSPVNTSQRPLPSPLVPIWSDRCNLTNAGGNGGPGETNHAELGQPIGGNVARIDGSVMWYPYLQDQATDANAVNKWILPSGAISGQQTLCPSSVILVHMNGYARSNTSGVPTGRANAGRAYLSYVNNGALAFERFFGGLN